MDSFEQDENGAAFESLSLPPLMPPDVVPIKVESDAKKIVRHLMGIMREALLDFYTNSGKKNPGQIIIFRDEVSESQFNQVLNKELDQVIEVCKFLDENWNPKFVVIVAQKKQQKTQKKNHTKFFQQGSPDNVLPCTVMDNKVGFLADDLHELVYYLSYMYQRNITAISVGSYLLCLFGSFTIGVIYEICGCFRDIIEPWWGDCFGSTLCTSAFQLKDNVSNFIC
ncbi:hypothetical protein J1N35_019662 [Gossypium stocksii]|uniref:Piwi domain-containing protein n=1 Tax=Gossypium stocksii TaxID=47602 RepID=A0A9D3VTB2_9ROSI|nr:hypothetical protein J1N35_019662 [Gossypium stocksii]